LGTFPGLERDACAPPLIAVTAAIEHLFSANTLPCDNEQ